MLKNPTLIKSLLKEPAMIGNVIYQLLPVDIVPDAIPVLGQMDDSLAMILLTAVVFVRLANGGNLNVDEKGEIS